MKCLYLIPLNATHLQVVQTDETARKPDHIPVSSEDERNAIFQLEKSIQSNEALQSELCITVFWLSNILQLHCIQVFG